MAASLSFPCSLPLTVHTSTPFHDSTCKCQSVISTFKQKKSSATVLSSTIIIYTQQHLAPYYCYYFCLFLNVLQRSTLHCFFFFLLLYFLLNVLVTRTRATYRCRCMYPYYVCRLYLANFCALELFGRRHPSHPPCARAFQRVCHYDLH